MKKRVVVLGAAGSIGRQTIDIIRSSMRSEHPLELAGFSIHRNMEVLARLRQEFPQAAAACTGSAQDAGEAVFSGPDALEKLLENANADIVVNGIAGAAGLSASVLTVRHGIDLALANKESIVMGYHLLRKLADLHGSAIVPVDSEHAALFQLFNRIGTRDIAELTITASGGPFRTTPLEMLPLMTPEDACRHPVWSMGRKISIDSATMANKGLELIEASRLFGLPQEKIKVLVHPQSIVHAMVRTTDGALYAHMSEPDMRLPIQAALYWPRTLPCPFGTANLAGKTLEFFEAEPERYPLLSLSRKAAEMGDAACICYNAADEVAVSAFEKGKIRFTDIARVVAESLEKDWNLPVRCFEDIFELDMKARRIAERAVEHCE